MHLNFFFQFWQCFYFWHWQIFYFTVVKKLHFWYCSTSAVPDFDLCMMVLSIRNFSLGFGGFSFSCSNSRTAKGIFYCFNRFSILMIKKLKN